MTNIYICSQIAKPILLKLFRIKHLFICDSKGNRYEVEVQEKRKIIYIRKSRIDLKKIIDNKEINYKVVEMPFRTFLKRLYNAINLLEGKRYRLFYRNCYSLIKYVISYPLPNLSISLIGNLK